jgi:DNA polymerase (family 10)
MQMESVLKQAVAMGYEYIGISDHSSNMAVTGGLTSRELSNKLDEIETYQEQFDNIIILKSAEVDILKNGDLDFPDDILKRLDYTICSVHTDMELSQEKQTERIIRAMDNKHFNILGHPTGRRLGERPPMKLNMEKLMDAAKERGCMMELNAQPARLDLNDTHCRLARDKEVMMIISTDTHGEDDMKKMSRGISQARRGWLSAHHIGNTLKWQKLKKLFQR